MRNKQVKTKQLKGGRHNGQWAVITFDPPSDDPTIQARTENEVTVAICRHAVVANVVADHFRKLFAGLDGPNIAGQVSEGKESAAREVGDTVPVSAVLLSDLKQAVDFKHQCDYSSEDALITGALKDANDWLTTSVNNLVRSLP